jgi:hypothetical protein
MHEEIRGHKMDDKERYDQYAAELAQRFEDLIKWAIENWPNKNFSLMQSDFEQSRKEIGQILGPKLSEGEASPPAPATGKDDPPFIDMNPAPWP